MSRIYSNFQNLVTLWKGDSHSKQHSKTAKIINIKIVVFQVRKEYLSTTPFQIEHVKIDNPWLHEGPGFREIEIKHILFLFEAFCKRRHFFGAEAKALELRKTHVFLKSNAHG